MVHAGIRLWLFGSDSMKMPKTILSHPAVESVTTGESTGSDRKYWVFFKNGWGYYEHGQRDSYYWISHGCGVDSVQQFKTFKLEHK